MTRRRPGSELLFASLLVLSLAAARLKAESSPDPLLIQLDEGEADTMVQISTPSASALPSQSTIKNRDQKSTDDFIPLLAPLTTTKKVELSRDENVEHGWLRLRNIYQKVNNGTSDHDTRLESGGSVNRIQGRALSLVWNGNVSYRGGNGFTSADDYHHRRLRLFNLALEQKQDDGGYGRLGRFVPVELPGLGYVDGALAESHPSEEVHLGAVFGARPDRRELNLSTRELMTSGYGSYEQGKPGAMYYSGTLGLVQSVFRGTRDETALLYDQRADLGPKFNAFFSSKVNFNTGAALVHTQAARMTRLDLYTNSPLTPIWSLRAGLNHFERPDISAERDLSGGDLTTFDAGYWRYWTGAVQHLPAQLQLDEEVALIQAPGYSNQTQVRGTLSRTGLFDMPQAVISLTGYSLSRLAGEGVGGIISAVFPLFENRFYLNANSGIRYSGLQGDSKDFGVSYASIYGDWFITRAWEAAIGATQTYENSIQSTLIDTSLNFRW